jgi:hypothetical protein
MAIREDLLDEITVSELTEGPLAVWVDGRGRVQLHDLETGECVADLGTVASSCDEWRAVLARSNASELYDAVERAVAAWEVWAAEEEQAERDRDDRGEIEAELNAEYYATRL